MNSVVPATSSLERVGVTPLGVGVAGLTKVTTFSIGAGTGALRGPIVSTVIEYKSRYDMTMALAVGIGTGVRVGALLGFAVASTSSGAEAWQAMVNTRVTMSRTLKKIIIADT